MPQYTQNRCSTCGLLTSPELLTIMRVQFVERTNPKKVIKSRVKAWLCEKCRDAEPDFNLPAYSSPGHDSPALERVRKARGEK